MSFQVGDKAKVVSIVAGGYGHEHIGKIVEVVEETSADHYSIKVDGEIETGWRSSELKLISRGNMSKKHYQVLVDTPLWLKGAILEEQDDGYRAISDLWDAVEDGLNGEYLTTHIIEKNPKFFARVYEMSKAGKAVYVTKEKAREMATKFYKAE